MGIHDATLEEAQVVFGRFQRTDRRPRLWAKLVEFIRETQICGFVEAVLVDGSFATATPDPNDIDLVIIARAGHDFSMDLTPDQYRVLAQRQVRRRFGFDIVVVENGTNSMEQAIAFFQQVKQKPDLRKGIWRILL